MEFRIVKKSVTGRRHAHRQEENQDYVQVMETETHICISVNDGCSSCRYPLQAARTNAQIAEQIAGNPMLWAQAKKSFLKSLQRIYRAQLTETGYPLSELCSTTAVIMIDKRTGDYAAYSVGDTAVLAIDANLNFRQLLIPINGTKKNVTIFTNSYEDIPKLGQFSKGKISEGVSGFLIYSDGAAHLAAEPFTEAQQFASAALLDADAGRMHSDVLSEQLAQLSSDDISFALIMLMNEQTKTAAAATYCGTLPETMQTEDDLPAVKPKCADAEAQPAEQKTRRAYRPFRIPSGDTKSADTVQLPPVMHFLSEARTANELMREYPELDQNNFLNIMMVLMRLGFVSAGKNDDNEVCFIRIA